MAAHRPSAAAFASVPLEEIANERYVVLAVDEAELAARRSWARTPWMPEVVFRTRPVEAFRSTVAAGTGVTIRSDTVSRPWSRAGLRLETRDPAEPVPTMDVGLVRRLGAELGAAARALRDFLSYTFNAAGQSLASR
ncbi:MAG: LysR substrate-binding domain-containing protein [Geminicoccaceae bacterium]|nr:LysR substrate-binding domain-containing protein [Geminicoccaceae bacterium]